MAGRSSEISRQPLIGIRNSCMGHFRLKQSKLFQSKNFKPPKIHEHPFFIEENSLNSYFLLVPQLFKKASKYSFVLFTMSAWLILSFM